MIVIMAGVLSIELQITSVVNYNIKNCKTAL